MDELFEKIYRDVCKRLCKKYEVMMRFKPEETSYFTSTAAELVNVLFIVALHMDADQETLAEIRALEGF